MNVHPPGCETAEAQFSPKAKRLRPSHAETPKHDSKIRLESPKYLPNPGRTLSCEPPTKFLMVLVESLKLNLPDIPRDPKSPLLMNPLVILRVTLQIPSTSYRLRPNPYILRP